MHWEAKTLEVVRNLAQAFYVICGKSGVLLLILLNLHWGSILLSLPCIESTLSKIQLEAREMAQKKSICCQVWWLEFDPQDHMAEGEIQLTLVSRPLTSTWILGHVPLPFPPPKSKV